MRPFSTSRGGRRGTVTVIVVAFLALFFVLALTFAFAALAEAENTKVFRDQASVSIGFGSPPDPDPLFNQALNDVIYGPEEGLPGAFNVIRGHDLARLMFGYNPRVWIPTTPSGWVLTIRSRSTASAACRFPATAVNTPVNQPTHLPVPLDRLPACRSTDGERVVGTHHVQRDDVRDRQQQLPRPEDWGESPAAPALTLRPGTIATTRRTPTTRTRT